jgi:serine/threonine protein kinase
LPGISPAIEQVVLRALAKDPDKRFASIWEFATAFEQSCTAWQANWPLNSTQEASLPLVSENQTYYLATSVSSANLQLAAELLSEYKTSPVVDKLSGQARTKSRRLSRRALIAGIPLILMVAILLFIVEPALACISWPGRQTARGLSLGEPAQMYRSGKQYNRLN